jgi:molecular chaperone GrpE
VTAQSTVGVLDGPALNSIDSGVESAASGAVTLQEALAAKEDAYLRLAADFDNYKRRIKRDSEQQAASQKDSFIRDLLPVLDNLERAIACDISIASRQIRQGVEMTLQHLRSLLHHHGIEPVEDVGLPFDPHRHEAISLRHDPLAPDQTILEVAQRGYRRGDNLFRPAKVVVNDTDHSAGANSAS